MSNAPKYQIVDDEGKLTGSAGGTVEMTSAEAAARSGLKLSTVRKRIQHGARKWSSITKDVDLARREGRARFSMQNTTHFAGEAGERNEKRAHMERVEGGHKDLD